MGPFTQKTKHRNIFNNADSYQIERQRRPHQIVLTCISVVYFLRIPLDLPVSLYGIFDDKILWIIADGRFFICLTPAGSLSYISRILMSCLAEICFDLQCSLTVQCVCFGIISPYLADPIYRLSSS